MAARVLIVVDAEFQRHVLARHIAAAGGQVAGEAASPEEAVQRYAEIKPDVVFLDLARPDAALASIRAIRQINPRARIALLASASQRDQVPDALDAGATDYLPKPFQPEQVRGVLERSARF